ncbi:unnamed protein product [Prunus armeniaca]
MATCKTLTSWHRPWHGFDVLHHAKASQGYVGGALVKQDKVGRHVFGAGNWQPRHSSKAAQCTRQTCAAQRAMRKACCAAHVGSWWLDVAVWLKTCWSGSRTWQNVSCVRQVSLVCVGITCFTACTLKPHGFGGEEKADLGGV